MKKIFALVLVAVMAMSLCGCTDKAAEQMKSDCIGTWIVDSNFTVDEATQLLKDYDFYEEEFALADLTQMKWVDSVTFNADGTYAYEYLAGPTREAYINWFDGMFTAIYANLDDFEELYGVTSADFESEADFKDTYATVIYQAENYDGFLNNLVDDIMYNYYDFNDMVYDKGTYVVTKDGIEMTEDGDTTAYLVGVVIEGSTLTMTYANNEVVVYTKK